MKKIIRPPRKKIPPKRLEDYAYCNIDSCYKVSNVPNTYNQAIKSADAELWMEAMDSEMKSLNENRTFTIIPLPKDRKPVGSRWVYAIKTDPDGNVIHKARFVAKGYAQVE